MKVHVRFVGVAPSDSEAAILEIERRVGHALDRPAHRVREVGVSLSDVNGPKGGLDQQCVLTITPRYAGEPVVARALERTRVEAVAKSLKRARRQLQDGLERAERQRVTDVTDIATTT